MSKEKSSDHNNIEEESSEYNNIEEESSEYNNIEEESLEHNNIEEESSEHNNIEKESSHDEDESDVEINTGMVIHHKHNAYFNMQVSIKINIPCIKIFHI